MLVLPAVRLILSLVCCHFLRREYRLPCCALVGSITFLSVLDEFLSFTLLAEGPLLLRVMGSLRHSLLLSGYQRVINQLLRLVAQSGPETASSLMLDCLKV